MLCTEVSLLNFLVALRGADLLALIKAVLGSAKLVKNGVDSNGSGEMRRKGVL